MSDRYNRIRVFEFSADTPLPQDGFFTGGKMNGKQADEQYLDDVILITEWYRQERDHVLRKCDDTGTRQANIWRMHLGEELGRKLTDAHSRFLDRVAEGKEMHAERE